MSKYDDPTAHPLQRRNPTQAQAQDASSAASTCPYCGWLGWTVAKYGRVTHKEACPHRSDRWHQGDTKASAARRRRSSEDVAREAVDAIRLALEAADSARAAVARCVRELTKAGALIAAEIDRLQRAEKLSAATCCGWHLLAKPKGWRGHVTWCRCGTLLVLRKGVWQRG